MAMTAHSTLTPNEPTLVQIDALARSIDVVNRTQTGAIWVRTDGTAPEPEGAGSYVVLGARSFDLPRSRVPHEIYLLCADEVDFSVEGNYR